METMAAMFAVSAATGGAAAGGGAALTAASIIPGVGATAAAASGAATAGGLFGTGLGLFDLLAGGLSIAQGVTSFIGGQQQGAALESQAAFEDFNARQELLKGKAAAVEELEALNATLAANTVAGFASGLQSSGSVAQANIDALKDAEFRLGMARTNAAIAAGGRRGTARSLRSDASGARTAGIAGAAGAGASLFDRVARRG